MKGCIVAAVFAMALTGCGGDSISEEEAASIAALSQDAEKYKDAFTEAIRELSGRDDCDAEVMRNNGGFSRVAGEPYYFMFCGEPQNISRRWYLDPSSGELTRFKAEL
tara:strand:- start:2134 stop:2457 length:324 start_codon:yes stop_codon:yes gene_type:complete